METTADHERVPVVQVADRLLHHELLPHSVPSCQLFFVMAASIVGVTAGYAGVSSSWLRHVDIHVVAVVFPREVGRERVRALVDLLADQRGTDFNDNPLNGLHEFTLLLALKGFDAVAATRLRFPLMRVVTADDGNHSENPMQFRV